MTDLVAKIRRSMRTVGPVATAIKALRYPFRNYRAKVLTGKVLSLKSAEDKFTLIYERNYWQSDESVSGVGSTMEYTKNLREKLPSLLQKYSIKEIFDAPCGDFNWMRHVLPHASAHYIGGDIVRPLVDGHNAKYKDSKIKFIHVDLIRDELPRADLMICRDCLFHLSFSDAIGVLSNFVRSGTPYLLTSTHNQEEGREFANVDISTGDFRLIDLNLSPFNFPMSALEAIDDWIPPNPPRRMRMWSRHQVAMAIGIKTE